MNRLPLKVCLIPYAMSAPISAYSEVDIAKYLSQKSLEELSNIEITLGTRGDGLSAIQSPVPLEVITAEDIQSTGYGELGKVLQRLLPSFNFPRTEQTDGTDHARPFTLRGMGTDQVLVLIDGKRRHPGALLHVNGTIGRGSTGVDINMIPVQAVERIEVLRDGAAAQYGSDAIAGIINIVLKHTTQEEVAVTIGQTTAGDGAVNQLAFSTGQALRRSGFVNLHGELRHRGATNRSGVDARHMYFEGDPRNAQLPGTTHKVGDAEIDDLLLMANAKIDGDVGYYANASFGYRHSEAGGFFRRPLDNRTVRAIYPDGFLPHIAPVIRDAGLTLGAQSDATSGWQWDASYTFGYNDFNFLVENSLNTSLGVDSPTEFDSGHLTFSQHILDIDAVKKVDVGSQYPLQVGLGAELRMEQFSIDPGEPDSYRHGGVAVLDGPNAGSDTAAGAQVFPGFQPHNEMDAERNNVSVYLDLEYAFNDQWRTQAAARYERYSDFGSTFNGKLAAAYTPSSAWVFRASTSTGFRAPSLAQSHYTATSTIFIDNVATELGTYNIDHALARDLGATDLKAEKSRHFGAGFSYKPSSKWLFSLDYFYTRINDRITLSGDIYQEADIYGSAVVDVLQQFGVLGARFFSNAIDTETQGIDTRLRYEWTLPKGRLNLSAQYHLNHTRLIGDVRAPTILGTNGPDVMMNQIERVRTQNGQSQDMIILSAVYDYQAWTMNVRLLRFGEYQLVNNLDPLLLQTVSAEWIADIDLSYQIQKNFNLAVGVHNLFDVTPDAYQGFDDDPFLGEGKIYPYATNSSFGFNGSFYYLRARYQF